MAAVENRPKRRPATRTASTARSNGSTRAAKPSGGARPAKAGRDESPAEVRVRRFDADRLDRKLDLERALASRPTARQLLWIDAGGEIPAKRLAAIAKRFGLEDETTTSLVTPLRRPHVAVHGSYFHVSVATPRNGPETDTDTWLDIIVGERIVMTRHTEPIRILDDLDERVQRDTTLGAVHGARFVALVLDAVVTSCFEAVDAIEDEIDVIDTRSLRDTRGRDLLDDLVALRRRIARLRRSMVAHRGVYGALTGPDVGQVVDDQDAVADLAAVSARFDAAIAAVEGSREALIGSFDVYMSRTAQRTNDVMKVLTIATVLLLPGSVIAGLLGMNVVVPLDKDSPYSFWIVIAGVATLAVILLVVARHRRWL